MEVSNMEILERMARSGIVPVVVLEMGICTEGKEQPRI